MARSNPDTYSMIPCLAKIVKLLIAELDDRLEADARLNATHKPPNDFDSNEVEEWEDVDEHTDDEFNRFDGNFLFLVFRI